MYKQYDNMNYDLWYKPEKQYDAKKRYEKHHREFINKIKNYGRQNVLNGYNQTSMWDNNTWGNNLLKSFGKDYNALLRQNLPLRQGIQYAQNNFNDIACDDGWDVSQHNPVSSLYNLGYRIGEFAFDTKLAYDYWQKMNTTGKRLVNTYGPGQGVGIDNYYHALLQCELAKISSQSKKNGLLLGYAKEYMMDYPKKRFFQGYSHDKIMQDSEKDLLNNFYGSNLGYYNQDMSCFDLLEAKRTPNMRQLGIR